MGRHTVRLGLRSKMTGIKETKRKKGKEKRRGQENVAAKRNISDTTED